MMFSPGVCATYIRLLLINKSQQEMESYIYLKENFTSHKFMLVKESASYLVCCGSYDANWKGEEESYNTGEDESPPWNLHLIIQDRAENERNSKCHS